MKSLKTKQVFFSIAILAIVIIAFGWYYFAVQPVSIQLKSDSSAYFNVDKPVVELSVSNFKDADNGQVAVTFDNSVLELSNVTTDDNVSYETLGNSVIFELTDAYVSSKNSKAAEMTFESLKPGSVIMGFDTEKTYMNNDDGEMELSLKDTSFEIGVAPRESEQNAGETNSKDLNEL